jgi:hypothetical protein
MCAAPAADEALCLGVCGANSPRPTHTHSHANVRGARAQRPPLAPLTPRSRALAPPRAHPQHIHALRRAHHSLAAHEPKRAAAGKPRSRQCEQRGVDASHGVADLADERRRAALALEPVKHTCCHWRCAGWDAVWRVMRRGVMR